MDMTNITPVNEEIKKDEKESTIISTTESNLFQLKK